MARDSSTNLTNKMKGRMACTPPTRRPQNCNFVKELQKELEDGGQIGQIGQTDQNNDGTPPQGPQKVNF